MQQAGTSALKTLSLGRLETEQPALDEPRTLVLSSKKIIVSFFGRAKALNSAGGKEMKQCDGGPVFVQLWVGGVNPDRAQKAIIDLTSRMAACWSHTLNLLLAARGLLAEGEGYQLRHGYVQIGGERVMAFVIEVVYERFEKGRQVASVPCARFDLVRKNWLKVPMAQGGFCEPNSSSWPAAQQIFTEIVAAVSWIEINR